MWVTAAKRVVYGDVGIDGVYGPTETLVVADASASPELAAADLIAQAEHDTHAMPVLVTVGEGTADRVEVEVDAQLDALESPETARQAVRGNGVSVIVDSAEEAIAAANAFAPEHLCLLVESARELRSSVTAAGGIFIGEHSGEVLGDYVAGPSYVMPTGGSARFASALNVGEFMKITTVVQVGDELLDEVSADAELIAHAEKLDAHARSLERRRRDR